MNANDSRSQSIDDNAIVGAKSMREGRLAVRDVDPRLALEAAPDWANLRARATAGDPSAMLTLELFRDEAASLARAVDWLHGLALEHHKLEVAKRLDEWRALGCRHGAGGAGK